MQGWSSRHTDVRLTPIDSKLNHVEASELLASFYQENSNLMSLLEPEKGLPQSVVVCLGILVRKEIIFFLSHILAGSLFEAV